MDLGTLEKNIEQMGSIVIGITVVLIMLSKFMAISGIGSVANASILKWITAIGGIADWGQILIIILIVAVLRTLYKNHK
jgi:hypothetical protein